jgi:hypothetical protein
MGQLVLTLYFDLMSAGLLPGYLIISGVGLLPCQVLSCCPLLVSVASLDCYW